MSDTSVCRLPVSDEVYAELDALASQEVYAVHQHPAWYQAYIQAFQIAPSDVCMLRVGPRSAAPVGLLPLQVVHCYPHPAIPTRHLIGLGKGPSDFCSLLVRPSHEADFAQGVATWLARHTQAWERLDISCIPASDACESLIKALARCGLSPVVDRSQGFLEIDANGDWDAYFECFYTHNNRNFVRKLRQLERNGLYPEVITVRENIGQRLPELLPLHTQRRKVRHQRDPYVHVPARRQFFEQALAEYEKTGSVELNILVDRNGCVWAFLLDWLHLGTRFHYMTAFNQEFSEFMPGKMVFYEVHKRSFSDPAIHTCNFCRGEHDYKCKITDERREYVSISVENPRSLRNQALHALSGAARLKNRLVRPSVLMSDR